MKIPCGCPTVEFMPQMPWPGSVKATCKCGNEMWVGPKSQKQFADGVVWLVCFECVGKKAESLGADIMIAPLDDEK